MERKISGHIGVGSTIRDNKTGEEWTFLGWTDSQSNYSCAKIRSNKNGVIRKLSLFADKGSSRDINRYVVIKEVK